MVYKQIGFNSALASKRSLSEFIAHEKHLGLSEDEMKEVHALCKAENKSQNAQKEEVSNEKPDFKSAG